MALKFETRDRSGPIQAAGRAAPGLGADIASVSDDDIREALHAIRGETSDADVAGVRAALSKPGEKVTRPMSLPEWALFPRSVGEIGSEVNLLSEARRKLDAKNDEIERFLARRD
jgi:hypothetical protein